MMKIYFAASIRGGRNDVAHYAQFITLLKNFGEVLTEHIADPHLTPHGESHLTDVQIHDRDMDWLLSADVVIAEVTTPSLGVGYEIGRAVENNIPVVCFYRKQGDRRLSAMIAGNKTITVIEYNQVQELPKILDNLPQLDNRAV